MKKKLLILDDSEDLLHVLKLFFEKGKWSVKTDSHGSQINALINEFNPDVLLIDVLLRGLDGRKICRSLRNSNETKHLGIIITSASPDNLENYTLCGADDYIEKPFDLDILNEKVMSLISWTPIRKKAHQHML